MRHGGAFRVGLLGILATAGLAGGAAGQSPGVAGAPGVAGTGVRLLSVPADRVGVVASSAVAVEEPGRGAMTRLMVIVGNGTDELVDVDAAWSATTPDGALVWVGMFGGYTVIGDSFDGGTVPEAIEPGGFALLLETPTSYTAMSGAPADTRYDVAVHGEEMRPFFADDVTLVIEAVELGPDAMTVRVTNPSAEVAPEDVETLAFCLDPDGIPTGSTGSLLRLDEPLAAGASLTVEMALPSVPCEDHVVSAIGLG
jgi:hypothetical protein